MNAMSYLLKGGPVMYVLLPMSAITLAVGIERLVVLGREKRQTEAVLDILRKNVLGKLDAKAVIALFDGEGRSGNLIVNRLLRLFIESELEGERLEFLIEAEALQEERRLKDRMWVLDTAVTMAPLLGLLGTIIGIVSSFHVMSISGLGKPTQITGGVAEALIATATGLVIAIVALGLYNFLHRWISGIKSSLESAARLITILHAPVREIYRSLPGMASAQSGFSESREISGAFRAQKGSSLA